MSNVAAVRAAVPSAHWLVVTRASTKTTPPIAASSSQPAWLAVTNPDRSGRPARFPARIEPVTAMPRHCPICRLVEAVPEATPAWDTGMPDTAVYVMGALTRPPPMPNTTNATASAARPEVAVSRDSSTPPAASPRPAASMGSRAPRRARIRLDTTAPSATMLAIGSRYKPALTADRARTSCRYSVARKRKPPMAAVALIAVRTDPANGALRKNLGSSTGSVRCAS